MSKYVYKVMTKEMESCWVDDSDWKIKYKLNEWNEPKQKGTMIFVFDTLENAKKFNDKKIGGNIWECEYVGKCEPIFTHGHKHVDYLKEFWKLFNRESPIIPRQWINYAYNEGLDWGVCVPIAQEGTVLVERLKPIALVK